MYMNFDNIGNVTDKIVVNGVNAQVVVFNELNTIHYDWQHNAIPTEELDDSNFSKRYEFGNTANGQEFARVFIERLNNSLFRPVDCFNANNAYNYKRVMYDFFLPDSRVVAGLFNADFAERFGESLADDNNYTLEGMSRWIAADIGNESYNNLVDFSTSVYWIVQDGYYVPCVEFNVSWSLEPTSYNIGLDDRKSYKLIVNTMEPTTLQFWLFSYTMTIPTRTVNFDLTEESGYDKFLRELAELEREWVVENTDNSELVEDSLSAGYYKVPANSNDLYTRTLCHIQHVTNFGEDGCPRTINPSYQKFADPNVWSHTQPAWRYGTPYWELNYNMKKSLGSSGQIVDVAEPQDSWVYNNGHWTSAGWFSPTQGRSGKEKTGGDWSWHPYTQVDNGYGHNPENGDTLAFEANWAYNYKDGNIAIDLRPIDYNTQSALCYSNLTYDSTVDTQPKEIYVYTEGEEYISTIYRGRTPTISLSFKGQNVGRMNLETNNVLTRW